MIYLAPEVKSGLGEDTFWTWFEREFPDSTFDDPMRATVDDIILQYGTLGPSKNKVAKTVALLWELYPEMERALGEKYQRQTDNLISSANACTRRVVASHIMVPDYAKFGQVDVLPIGVDTDVFRPMNKAQLRVNYGLNSDDRVGFWCGTKHPMKGFDRLKRYAHLNPSIKWIIIWKSPEESESWGAAITKTRVSQRVLAELMNCADFFLVSGLLRPYFMWEWEAMACNLSPRFLDDPRVKDFMPGDHPRIDIFDRGWDRRNAKKIWADYLKGM